MENKRLGEGLVTQRQVLYLGEANDSQRAAWRKTIEVCVEGNVAPQNCGGSCPNVTRCSWL